MMTADDIFRTELEKRGVEFAVSPEGKYEVRIHEQTITVSLDNIRRNYFRDSDEGAVVRFVDMVTIDFFAEIPEWVQVRSFVRYSIEPSNYETGFDDVIVEPINEELNQVFVYPSADGSRITWIDESTLDHWAVTRAEMIAQAEENMRVIVYESQLEVEEVADRRLGLIKTSETPFKAALILSPAFKDLVVPTFGWPVYVVIPCRDFAYVIHQDDQELLGQIGAVVVDEYGKSGHPITRDVLRLSDEGITPIGTYQEPE